jgi:hypothetical protein
MVAGDRQQAAVGLGRAWLRRERGAIGDERLFDLSLVLECRDQAVPCAKEIRLQREDLPIARHRLVEPA